MAPVRTWERSSSRVTSRTQCTSFSIVFPHMTKRLVRPVGVGGHDVADLHAMPDHDDAVDQELVQRAVGKRSRSSSPRALGVERLHRAGERLRIEVLPRVGVDLPLLGDETFLAAPRPWLAGHTRRRGSSRRTASSR